MSNFEDFIIRDGVLQTCLSDEREIVIPDGVKEIQARCFQGHSAAPEIVALPSSLTTIGENCFANSVLKSIHIPASVTSIGKDCFRETQLESITVEQGNPVYRAVGGCLIEIASSKLIIACKGSVIPDDGSVKVLGAFCFSANSRIKRLDIPATVTTIEDFALCDCSLLRSVALPNSVTSLGNYCFPDMIERILIPASVTSIDSECFAEAYNLTIYADEDSYASEFADDYCIDLDYPENYKEKVVGSFICDDECLMCYVGEDTDVFIPERITFLGGSCFSSCNHVKRVYLNDRVTDLGEGVFDGCTSLEQVVLCGSFTELPYMLFNNCSGLKSIFVPKSVSRIDSCFGGCTALESIFLLPSVEYISDDAFNDCKNLTIYAAKNSYAAKYAENKGIPLKFIESDNDDDEDLDEDFYEEEYYEEYDEEYDEEDEG